MNVDELRRVNAFGLESERNRVEHGRTVDLGAFSSLCDLNRAVRSSTSHQIRLPTSHHRDGRGRAATSEGRCRGGLTVRPSADGAPRHARALP